MNRFKRILPIALLAVLAVAAIVYSNQRKALAPAVPQNESAAAGSVAAKPDSNTPIRYQGEEGKSALALLKQKHQTEVKDFSFGQMVVGIDGVTPDNKHFWGFYVNGSLSQVGADAYVTKPTDVIEWKIEEIK